VLESNEMHPDQLIFSHPPSSPEALIRFAAWAERARRTLQITIVYAQSDLTTLPGHGRARVPTIADVRETYRHLLKIARNGYAMVAADGLPSSPRGSNRLRPDKFKASLYVLEVARFITRHDDLPRAATVTLRNENVWLSAPLRAAAGAAVGMPAPIEPLALAFEVGVGPQKLQRDMLQAERSGSLLYRGHGRDRLYAVSASGTTPATPEELLRFVRSLEARATQDATAMAELIAGRGCRRQTLDSIIGWTPSRPCGHCDRCLREYTSDVMPRRADTVVALMAVAALPFTLRRGAIHRIVATAMKDEGRPSDKQRIHDIVEELLSRNLLVAVPGNLGEVLGISEQGRSALAAWDDAGHESQTP
jgi:hypothetical protein